MKRFLLALILITLLLLVTASEGHLISAQTPKTPGECEVTKPNGIAAGVKERAPGS